MTLELQAIRNVTKNYGPRTTDEKYGARVKSSDLIHMARWEFTYDDLPAGGISNHEQVIPANSTIVSARMRILEAFTSTSTTTDLTVGLEEGDGTVIDANGLVTAAEATQTAIASVGNLIDGAGVLIGDTIGTENGELVVAPTVADLLTGRAEVIVEYMVPAPASA